MRELTEVLRRLYREQLEANPADNYLREHSSPAFLEGTVQVFEFYRSYLTAGGRILDWGCHHGPDSCLIRAALGDTVGIDGCDVIDPEQYSVFHSFAGLHYQRLRHAFQLPYQDSCFDMVIASGVLEHVPMDYESLKELNRVLKPGGRIAIAYLPNRRSVQEWWLRVSGRGDFHRHLYGRGELTAMLLRCGFLPLAAGYQTRIDCLPAYGGALARTAARGLRACQAHRFTSCLCAVAAKVESF